jgi:EAL domain-containing protein (putative c-di-GMP-specific phosphodiesterase class I)
MPTLLEVLDQRLLIAHLQPLVSVKKRSVIGLEALARVAGPGRATSPQDLFQQAHDQRLNEALDEQCIEQALQAFTALPRRGPDLLLFLNLDARRLERGQLSAHSLSRSVERSGLSARDVVLEFSARAVANAPGLRSLIETCRSFGFSVALDDVDAGSLSMQDLAHLRPDLVKADLALVKDLGRDPVRQEQLRAVAALARRQGALLVAEGIENEDDAALCLEQGADLLQGFHYGRPTDADKLNLTLAQAAAERSAERLKANLSGRHLARQREDERHLGLLQRIREGLQKTEAAQATAVLEQFVNAVASLECLWVMDARGRQLTPTVVWRHQREAARSRLFAPALPGADHSLKDYCLGLTLRDRDPYLSEPYVSLATGNLCRTLSTSVSSADGVPLMLCMDIRSV